MAPHFFSDMTDSFLTDPAEQKRALRKELLRQREGCVRYSAVLCSRLERFLETRDEAVVACVWPLAGEPDLRPLCDVLYARGRRVVLPETPRKGGPLTFREWRPGCRMVTGRYGTEHPEEAVCRPELILVPMLGFDRRGYRLGYGGGYYDRTLAALPGVGAVGFAFSCQEVSEVPVGPYDVPLSVIVTERGVIHCGAERG